MKLCVLISFIKVQVARSTLETIVLLLNFLYTLLIAVEREPDHFF